MPDNMLGAFGLGETMLGGDMASGGGGGVGGGGGLGGDSALLGTWTTGVDMLGGANGGGAGGGGGGGGGGLIVIKRIEGLKIDGLSSMAVTTVRANEKLNIDGTSTVVVDKTGRRRAFAMASTGVGSVGITTVRRLKQVGWTSTAGETSIIVLPPDVNEGRPSSAMPENAPVYVPRERKNIRFGRRFNG